MCSSGSARYDEGVYVPLTGHCMETSGNHYDPTPPCELLEKEALL